MAVLLEEDDALDSLEVAENDKDRVEAKAEAWLKDNVFSEFYVLFLEGAQKLEDPTLTTAFISFRKSELYENTEKDPDEVSDLLESFEEVLKTLAIWRVAE